MGNVLHMTVFEKALAGSDEWSFTTDHWAVMQLYEGIAYIRDTESYGDILLGGGIVCPPGASVRLMASALGGAKIRGVLLRIDAMSGFLTAIERRCLETLAPKQFGAFQMVSPDHLLAAHLNEICQSQNMAVLSNRLAFLHGFAEVLSPYLNAAVAQGEETFQDAEDRLRQLIHQTPEAELESLSFGRMAEHLHCCERNARRLFAKVCGCSFRGYVSELRLKKACQLLARGQSKIIDVALESGHSSLPLFNYLFKKRFGMTPSAWRQQNQSCEKSKLLGRIVSRERPGVRQRLMPAMGM